MLCKNCNGTLVVKKGVYVCDSCGSKYPIDNYYEDIDVFICYVENDSAGRRTRDSIIAQDLYQKIEAKNIKGFYSRISASNLIGQEYEKTIIAAMNKAKTIILLGTSREYFEKMSNLYSEVYKEKIIIPVFSNMDPKNIPKNISSIQALNYDKIGSDIDLIKGLLNALGRENEVEKLVERNTNADKSKIILIISVLVLIIGVGIICLALQINWADKNNSEPASTTSQNQDNNSDNYELAMKYIEDEKYVDAIVLLSDMSGYKDSDKQLQKIYDIYSGYYQDFENGIDLYFQVVDGKNATVEINYNIDSQQLLITETSLIEGNLISSDYIDSEGNQGSIEISILDNGLQLIINTDSINSDLYIPSINITFNISEKSDKPFEKPITLDDLLDIIDEKTSVSELKRQGYNVVRIKTVEHQEFNLSLYDIYQIENTDIELKVVYPYEDPMMLYTNNVDNIPEENSVIDGITAPAEIIIPELIGEEGTPFVKDDVLYIPNKKIDLYEDYEIIVINKNTPVYITSKNTVGEDDFLYLVDHYCIPDGDFRTESSYEDEFFEEPSEEYSYEDGIYEEITEEYYEDETSNVICPMCGTEYFITGVGIDGLFCDCGCNWMPICYICSDENATSIWIDDHFVCQLCGEGWLP